MSNTPKGLNRRDALKLMAATAVAIPVGSLLSSRPALAADMPHVNESDPMAMAMKYKHDASEAPRVEKAGVPAAEQTCANCMLAQGEGEWIGCSIFPGKAVNANGWCTAWAKRPA